MTVLAAMPKYEAYKDSGVEWLGGIPESWELKRLAVIGQFSKGGGFSKSDLTNTGVSAILYGDIYTKYEHSIDKVRRKIPIKKSQKAVAIKKYDLLFTGSGETKEDIGKCVVYNSDDLAYAGGDIIIFRQNFYNSNFLSFYLNTRGVMEEKAKTSKGEIIVHTYASKLRKIIVPTPAIKEQAAIANFLDKKTAQIDEAIAIKQKQIELLKERKQILIQRAVTQGLDPNVPMRDSGVDWIGDIPEHWEVRRSKFLFTQRKERAWKDDVQLSATQAYGVIPQHEYEARTGKTVVKIQFHLDKRKHVEKDDFVISMRSFQGGLERAWSSGCIRSSYIILKPLEKIDPAFYGYLLKLPSYIKALQRTASFIRDGQDLNFENFSKIDLFIPPLDEQYSIAKHIKQFMISSENGIELLQQQIQNLKEYKTTLINSAVTGKIKIVGNADDV